jgi:DNA polymerase-1
MDPVRYWSSFSKICAVDTETTGLDIYGEDYCTDMSWANNTEGTSGVVPADSSRFLSFGQWLFDQDDILKVFWNAKFDIPVLRRAGINVKGPIADAMLLARLIHSNEQTVNLKHMARKYLGELFDEEKKMKEWLKKNPDKAHGQAPDRIRIPYARKDAECTMLLWELMIEEASSNTLEIFNLEMEVLPVTQAMEQRGLRIDMAAVNESRRKAIAERQKIKRYLSKKVGAEFNPRSHLQVRKVIYDGTTKVRFYTDSKNPQPATSRVALQSSGHKLAKAILKFREWDKLASTYCDGILRACNDRGVVHPSFNQAGTRTGRYSSSDPNFQNLPRPGESPLGHVKDFVIARPGYRLLLIDYQQLEIRIAAHYSQQDHLCDAILHGKDIHSESCKAVFDKKESSPDWNEYRFYAKTFNFAIQYGAGAQKLQMTILEQTGVWMPLHKVSRLVEKYAARNDRIMDLFPQVAREIGKTGGVTTDYGRMIKVQRGKEYAGVNYKIQGTAADLIKSKMPMASTLLVGSRSYLVLQIHDELGFELHQKDRALVPQLKETMEELDKFIVPMTCDVKYGKRWGKKKSYPIHA